MLLGVRFYTALLKNVAKAVADRAALMIPIFTIQWVRSFLVLIAYIEIFIL